MQATHAVPGRWDAQRCGRCGLDVKRTSWVWCTWQRGSEYMDMARARRLTLALMVREEMARLFVLLL